MSKQGLIATICATILAAVTVCAFANRYVVRVAGPGLAYKTDRFTGKTWTIFNGRESEIHGSGYQHPDYRPPDELPDAELTKLEGKAEILANGDVSTKIYNSSTYGLTELSVRIGVKDAGGKMTLDRVYAAGRLGLGIGQQFQNSEFRFEADLHLGSGETWSWVIVGAKGYAQSSQR